MATFGITPVTGYPLPPSDDFPQFIQFQNSGADLGAPDADTLNFATGATATRGTGENANVITVAVESTAGGTVTSVALEAPAEFAVAGSPITVDGTLVLSKATQNANEVWAGPTTGADAQPAFRALVNADMPAAVANATFDTQVKNLVWAGPASGANAAPTFRALVDADLPVASRAFTWRTPSPGAYTLVLGDAENGVAINGATVTIPPHSSVAFPDGTSVVLLDVGYMNPFTVTPGSGVTLIHRSALNPASAGQYGTVTVIQYGVDNWVVSGDLEVA